MQRGAAQIGSGDRSEKITFYNFPQSRVTDHRINKTVYRLDQVLDGDLDEFIDELSESDQTEQLQAVKPICEALASWCARIMGTRRAASDVIRAAGDRWR